MSTGRKPNWSLCIKQGERWHSIGAAWETEKGNLFVKIDEGETLRGTAMLFPYREKPSRSAGIYLRPAYGKNRPLPPLPSVPTMDPDPEAPEWL